MSLLGKTVGRYRVTEKLGEGGMGVVYKAEDAALGRSVALKVLRRRDPERVRRFAQEARAASALNHPNIITVHDAGEFEGEPYLVMELVEGESLRARLEARGALPFREVLDVGTQAATALARAHGSGITHRDLKPENIFLRPDGYLKILDFGLAKLREPEERPSAGATATADFSRSMAGVVGTAAYMAPEQAQGLEADARSDVFSLALVLYECWQGRNPFSRGNLLDTLHAVVHDRLPALSVPPASQEWALARIIEKALEKNPDDRYQTMMELGIDLRRLKQESESGQVATAAVPAVPAIPRRKLLLYGGLAGLAVLLALVALLLWRQRRPPAPARAEYVQITNFTDSATQPSLSPDGRMLAFIRGPGTFATKGQIYVKLLPDGEPKQLTQDDFGKMSPLFSPDGSRIAYTTTEGNSWDTWVVPVLGGEPQRLLPNASGLTWVSPLVDPKRGAMEALGIGERRLLFSEIRKGVHMAIVTATESRAQSRDIYVPPTEQGMVHRSYLSPDGKWVLLAAEMDATGWLPCRVVPFDGSSTGRLVGPPAAQCTAGAWSPDGEWMYFTANAGSGYHIWRQRFPDGAPEQITFGATEEEGAALAPDGRSFITSVGTVQSAVWVHDAAGDRQVSSEGFAYLPSFSTDGRRLYYLLRSGASRSFVSGELWAVEPDSGRRERLLPDFLVADYNVSADDKRVVFSALDESGKAHLWLASLDRRFPPRKLTSTDEFRAFFGPSGGLFFLAPEGKSKFIYRIKEDGTGLQKVIPDPVIYLVSVSPDGQWVVAWAPVAGIENNSAIRAYPSSGGPSVLICDSCIGGAGPGRRQTPVVGWAPDGKYFYVAFQYFSARGSDKTFVIPLRGGQALPRLPVSGIKSEKDLARLPGVQVIPQRNVFPGPSPSVYAFFRQSARRNLYRIQMP